LLTILWGTEFRPAIYISHRLLVEILALEELSVAKLGSAFKAPLQLERDMHLLRCP
jgi:hypothetical protein